jgi:hypothetical protein
MEPGLHRPRQRRAVRERFAHFLMTLTSLLRGDSGDERQFASEVRLGAPLTIRPGSFASGAQAWQGCLEGNYIYPYRISSGVHAGDVWLCCVPIDELLRETFQCGGLQRPSIFGSAADQKVQTCLLLNPVSAEPEFCPACIPAPLTAPTAPRGTP